MSEEIKSLGDLEAVAGGAEAVVEIAAPREPVHGVGRSYATGKRKDAVARVWIKQVQAKSQSAKR